MQMYKLFPKLDKLNHYTDEIKLEADFLAKWFEQQLICVADPSELAWLLMVQLQQLNGDQRDKSDSLVHCKKCKAHFSTKEIGDNSSCPHCHSILTSAHHH